MQAAGVEILDGIGRVEEANLADLRLAGLARTVVMGVSGKDGCVRDWVTPFVLKWAAAGRVFREFWLVGSLVARQYLECHPGKRLEQALMQPQADLVGVARRLRFEQLPPLGRVARPAWLAHQFCRVLN